MSSPLPASKTLKSTLKDTPGAGSSKGFATTTGNDKESKTELLMALTGALNSINAAGGKALHLVTAMEGIAADIGKQFQVCIVPYAFNPIISTSDMLLCVYRAPLTLPRRQTCSSWWRSCRRPRTRHRRSWRRRLQQLQQPWRSWRPPR
jgi:hypothetical protein